MPPVVEQWLKARMAGSDAIHVVNMPSTPPGWSAGKWGEWYADMDDGKQGLTTKIPKAYWQSGWRLQHDRLLRAHPRCAGAIPLFISGDIHALGEARILKTSGIDLRSNPVITVLPGPVGTGRPGWPSLVRGLRALPPAGLEVEEGLPTLEENGFTIADFTPERVTLRYFRWKLGRPEAALDTLEPFRVTNLVVREVNCMNRPIAAGDWREGGCGRSVVSARLLEAAPKLRVTTLELLPMRATARTVWLFVRLGTDAGLKGVGEASDAFGFANTRQQNAATMEAELRALFGLVQGKSPLEVAAYVREGERLAKGRGLDSRDGLQRDRTGALGSVG